MKVLKTTAFLFIFIQNFLVLATSTQKRLDVDIAAGKPVVIHLSVALADNKNQGIVPVPAVIGNGQNAGANLYWGARYGVKTYMVRDGGWKKVSSGKIQDKRILERLVLRKKFFRKGRSVPVYIVADAWDGKYISQTIKQFLRYNGGHDSLAVRVDGKTMTAGGRAHLMVYIGHNALMDYGGARDKLIVTPHPTKENPVNDAIVLACVSNKYFSPRLEKLAAHPLVMTTGLMAPEAYTLQGAIEQWIHGATDTKIRKAAAESYNKYQKTGLRAAERLFGVRK